MNQEKIWEAFQNDEELLDVGFPARKRFDFLTKQISIGSSILNIGVGKGYLEKVLVDKGVSVSCLDPSEAAIEKIREKLNLGKKAQVGYSQSIPYPDASFDYVIMSEVLEHLDDEVIGKTLLDVRRVLKRNGKFLGTVPADEALNAGVVVCPNCADHFHRWGHVQSFSQERLFNLLSSEFNNANVRRVLLSDFKQLNWKGKILDLLKKTQVLMNLKGSNHNFFFVAKK
ncbi:MAG: class I SAM-dependent methyltransferase [Piscirickettsiaceae bacterium]|jgi:SAM-dependent methyltransferase|nr:class I SAM-dependent methyltransferase [Piscirickettsiaceae bacterium]